MMLTAGCFAQPAAADVFYSSSEGNAFAEEDMYIVEENAPEIEGLTYEKSIKLDYADCFDVYYYNDGYKLIDVEISGQYLLVPEGKDVPEGLNKDIRVIYQPLDEIYMAATGSVSFFSELDAMEYLTMSSLEVDGWMLDAAIEADRKSVV